MRRCRDCGCDYAGQWQRGRRTDQGLCLHSGVLATANCTERVLTAHLPQVGSTNRIDFRAADIVTLQGGACTLADSSDGRGIPVMGVTTWTVTSVPANGDMTIAEKLTISSVGTCTVRRVLTSGTPYNKAVTFEFRPSEVPSTGESSASPALHSTVYTGERTNATTTTKQMGPLPQVPGLTPPSQFLTSSLVSTVFWEPLRRLATTRQSRSEWVPGACDIHSLLS